MDLLKTAERPILIHCRSGADRTSEETVIYAMEYMGQSKEQVIEKHMGIKYFHFEIFQPSKKYFMQHYQGEEWVRSTYDECTDEFINFNKYLTLVLNKITLTHYKIKVWIKSIISFNVSTFYFVLRKSIALVPKTI